MRNTLDMHEIRDVPATVKSMAHDMLQLDAEKIVRAERNRLGFDIQAENAPDAAIRSHPASSDDDAVVDLTHVPPPSPRSQEEKDEILDETAPAEDEGGPVEQAQKGARRGKRR